MLSTSNTKPGRKVAAPARTDGSSVERVRQALRASGLDGVVAISPDNVLYLSGVLLSTQRLIPERLAAVVIARGGSPVAIVSSVEATIMRRDSWLADVRSYVEGHEAPMDAITAVLREQGLDHGQLGIEHWSLPMVYAERLRTLIPAARLMPADDVLAHARALKGPQEVEILRHGAVSTVDAIRRAFERARPGVSELDCANWILCDLHEAGARSTWMMVASGANATVAHHHALPNKPIKAGEIVYVDCGGVFDGYYSDVARMAVVGTPTLEQQTRYAWLVQTLRRVAESVQPGRTAGEVFDIAEREYKAAGYPFTSPLIGHGIGIALHERPIIQRGEIAGFEPGMIISVEMGLPDGHGSRLHLEDLLLVAEDSPRMLTGSDLSDQLFVIE